MVTRRTWGFGVKNIVGSASAKRYRGSSYNLHHDSVVVGSTPARAAIEYLEWKPKVNL